MKTPKNDGGTAFPVTPTDLSGQIAPTQCGMTLRDYFAAKAMTATICTHEQAMKEGEIHGSEFAKTVADSCYGIADAMIAKRRELPI